MTPENQTPEQFARDAAGRIAREHYLGLTCFCAFNEFGGLVQECSSCSGIKSLVWEIEKALTQSTAQQSSEIERLKGELLKAANWLMENHKLRAENAQLRATLETISKIKGNPPIEVARKFATKSLTSSPQNGEKGEK